ncbi:MAG: hypothetical protein R3192_00340 [Woeseiaceae bacterium]|nr:hypothetical protein [Woeseiaceae bacterium]
MTTDTNSEIDADVADRWTLIRDIVVFQLKLVVDGLRDLVLVPVSLVIGVASLVKGGDLARSGFYELLRQGRRSERWINLFGAVDRLPGSSAESGLAAAQDIDEIFMRMESFVVDEYRKGGVTRQAKDQLDRALDSLHKIASKSKNAETDSD